MKGSLKCILDWVSDPGFLTSINGMLAGSGALVGPSDIYHPTSHVQPDEAELKDFLKHSSFPPTVSADIINWWLATGSPTTRTPNWDFISTCQINGQPGILLVEAKAHEDEIGHGGKPMASEASYDSRKNHERIGLAIQQASDGITNSGYPNSISRDRCYQLSNRVAHAWWLANEGIPVVLLYLGFLNVQNMNNGRNTLFQNHKDWNDCFTNHAKQIGVDTLVGLQVPVGKSHFQLLVKSV